MNVVQRAFAARAGTILKQIQAVRRATQSVGRGVFDHEEAFANDFAAQTSRAINRKLNHHFTPRTAKFLKKKWATIQLSQLAEINHWTSAKDVCPWFPLLISLHSRPSPMPSHTSCASEMEFPLVEGMWNVNNRLVMDGTGADGVVEDALALFG